MRVKALKHSFERPVDEFFLLNVLDIVLLNHVKHLAEALQGIIIGIRTARAHHSAPGKKKDQSQGTYG